MIDGASAIDLFVFTIEITGTNVDFFLYNRSVTAEGKKETVKIERYFTNSDVSLYINLYGFIKLSDVPCQRD